jgi:hypothetical protein
MERPGHYFNYEMREAKKKTQFAAMYQVLVGGVSHRTTIESRLLRH